MTRNLEQGLLNVLIEHHPKIGDIIFNYLKVMFKIPKIAHLPSPEESRKDSCSPDSKQSFQDRLYFQSWVMPKPLFHSSRPTEMQSGVSGTLFRQKKWWAPECSTLRQLVLTCLDQDSYASKPLCLWARHQTCQGPSELVQELVDAEQWDLLNLFLQK
jgi:hypothetical protein